MVFEVLSGFVLGIASSFHCVGMCGPIALALPGSEFSPVKNFSVKMLYNFGRVFTYTCLGLIFGLLGLSFQLAGLQQWLSIIIGLTVIFSVFWVSFKPHVPNWVARSWIFKSIQKGLGKLIRQNKPGSFFAMGLLNGLLPCGVVYTALALATALSNSLSGAMFMFFFGLGTIPMMQVIAFFGKSLVKRFSQRSMTIAKSMIVIIGILFVLRGLNLGIPFVSPKMNDSGVSCCSTKK